MYIKVDNEIIEFGGTWSSHGNNPFPILKINPKQQGLTALEVKCQDRNRMTYFTDIILSAIIMGAHLVDLQTELIFIDGDIWGFDEILEAYNDKVKYFKEKEGE